MTVRAQGSYLLRATSFTISTQFIDKISTLPCGLGSPASDNALAIVGLGEHGEVLCYMDQK